MLLLSIEDQSGHGVTGGKLLAGQFFAFLRFKGELVELKMAVVGALAVNYLHGLGI